jgi:hypothetical protein
MNHDAWLLVIATVAGLVCGFHTVASSGSAVSLPILMALGLHAINADATNRLPVLIGSVAATFQLARRKAIPWRMAFSISIPTTIGSIAGALLPESIPSSDLRLFIVAAVAMALILILTKLKQLINSAHSGEARFGTIATRLRELVRPDGWPQPDERCEDVCRCTQHFVVNMVNRSIGKVDFGIGSSLHQCVPLSDRACHAIVSMLSSECHLTQLRPERTGKARLSLAERRKSAACI